MALGQVLPLSSGFPWVHPQCPTHPPAEPAAREAIAARLRPALSGTPIGYYFPRWRDVGLLGFSGAGDVGALSGESGVALSGATVGLRDAGVRSGPLFSI